MPLGFDPIAAARSNWEDHGWESPEAMVAATSIARAHQVVLAQIDAALAPHGLTFSRFEALALLHFSRRGSLPMGKLGDRLQVHPASVTNAVARLVDAGLVERIPHPRDGRGVLARITDEGRRVVAAATERLNAEVFAELGLTAAEARRLTSLLRKVRTASGD